MCQSERRVAGTQRRNWWRRRSATRVQTKNRTAPLRTGAPYLGTSRLVTAAVRVDHILRRQLTCPV